MYVNLALQASRRCPERRQHQGIFLTIGARIELSPTIRSDLLLFAEAPSRILISFPAEHRSEVERMAKRCGAPLALVGRTGGDTLEIVGMLDLELTKMAQAWRNGLAETLGLS